MAEVFAIRNGFFLSILPKNKAGIVSKTGEAFTTSKKGRSMLF